MAFNNEVKNKRLLNIEIAEHLFTDISSTSSEYSKKEALACALEGECFYLLPSLIDTSEYDIAYNMPFLLDENGEPWAEANAYLCHLITNKHYKSRPTDDLRRKASRLLSFKIYCENNGINWLDFSGRRPPQRPTYRFYFHLVNELGLKARVINLYTSDVYYFYKYLSENWKEYAIDLDRVDTTETIKIYIQHSNGTIVKEVLKRSQTKKIPRSNSDSIGYVLDNGELLRPLTVEQWSELKTIINGDGWSNVERLLVLIAATTGARKQTVLTLKVRHIKKLVNSKIGKDGFYKLFIGIGTGVDVKNDKNQALYFHPNLINEINTYVDSNQAKNRREKFKANYAKQYPAQSTITDDDMYVFLSEQGNCYYMAKDDPRYPFIKSRPSGQVVDNLKRKILRLTTDDFPSEFYYHWLRATFAYLLWLSLQNLIEKGSIDHATAMSIVQNRLNHEDRETTENYLKLFNNIDIRLDMQEAYEDFLMGDLLNGDLVSE